MQAHESESLRIGIISDIHFGPNRATRLGTRALEIVEEFVVAMNRAFAPDIVVDLGDRVLDVDRTTDTRNQIRVHSVFKGLRVPVVHVLGNHDCIYLSQEENEQIFEQPMGFRSFDYKGTHFVVLNTCDPVIGGIGGSVSPEQLEWLRYDLDRNHLRTVIFCHHPIDWQDISSNIHFKTIEPWAFIANREEVWSILGAHSQIIAVFNGHLHWNSMEVVNGVPCFCVNSPVEVWTTGGVVPAANYAEVTIPAQGTILFNVRGINGGVFRFD